jgi:glutathione S-transferase
MPTVHGASASPFVRKVRIALIEKGIPYELNPVIPMPPANSTPEFRRMSPLGKIPAYEDGDFAISDSSVICAYLERVHPNPPLYPSQPRDYARALWFEEFADSKLAEAVGKVFFERVIAPRFFQRQPDEAAVASALGEALPPLLDYVEAQIGDREYLVGGRFTVADLALGSMFAQLVHAGAPLDAARWPRTAAYAARLHERPSFKGCLEEERRFFASS